MFDPTIFDNLKVVFEGAVYDLELDEVVQITDRIDRVELSSMSRSFGMTMKKQHNGAALASFMIKATVADLSSELLAVPKQKPGCSLELSFEFLILQIERDCRDALAIIEEIWGKEPQITQHIRVKYGQQPSEMNNQLMVQFPYKLNESHIDDIASLLEHIVLSLDRFDERVLI